MPEEMDMMHERTFGGYCVAIQGLLLPNSFNFPLHCFPGPPLWRAFLFCAGGHLAECRLNLG